MSTEQFLLALRRFVARRGQPISILSDNAAQFKLAKSTLERIYGKTILSQPVKDYIATNQIQWNFITERSPWMGGFYERLLVGSVKRALKKSIGKLLLHSVQLRTWLTEVEAVINSRPLTAISDSPDDCEVLTPRHFLSLNPRLGRIPSKSTKPTTERTSDNLLESWKRGKQHLERFWKIWYIDYIAALRERSDYKHRQSNDVVLIKEELQPRGNWKRGRVSEVYPGKDGCLRTVKLQLPKGKSLVRPVKILYPLELNNDVTLTLKEHSRSSDVNEEADRLCTSKLPEQAKQPESSFLRLLNPQQRIFPFNLLRTKQSNQ